MPHDDRWTVMASRAQQQLLIKLVVIFASDIKLRLNAAHKI
jgi:hypothetical protein